MGRRRPLNLNLHLHTHVIDGVLAERDDGSLDFHAFRPPKPKELRVLVSIIDHQVLLLAVKLGLLYNDDLPDIDHPLLATRGAADGPDVHDQYDAFDANHDDPDPAA